MRIFHIVHVNGDIEHTGEVIAVEHDRVDVVMHVEEACSSCKVRNTCSMGTSREKAVTVFTEVARYFEPGEKVVVSVHRTMGMKAVTIAYIVPFFVMLAVLLILIGAGVGEATAGLVSLAAVAVYFIGVAVFRKHIEKEITFKIRKIE